MGLSNDSHVTAYGYRADKKYVQEVGLRKCFLTGGNSTLRQHCRKHYEIYKQRCEESNIPLNDRAIPPQILKKKDKGKLTKQMTIDNMLDKGVARRQEFSKEAILRAASQFVACDDQALSVAGEERKEGSGYLVIVQDDDQDRPQQRGINALSEDWLLTVCKGRICEW